MHARGIESHWIRGIAVALAAALLPGCLPKGFDLNFLMEFDKPLAPVEAAVEVPGLEGEWCSRDGSREVTIELLRAAHLPPHLYRVSERDNNVEYSGVGWIVKAGDSLYVNYVDLEDEHIASAESFAEWQRTGDTEAVIMRLEVTGDALRTFVMQDDAPAVKKMFADGVLTKQDGVVVTNGLCEAMAAIAGADAFPEEQINDDLERVSVPKESR